MKTQIFMGSFVLILILNLVLVSALVVSDVNYGELFPGQETDLTISVKNTLEEDIEEVSFNLDFTNSVFTPVGGSEKNFDEIREDKTKDFNFRIKAGNDASPGDYQIPYKISYKDGTDKTGTIGIIIKGKAELIVTLNTENNVVGNNGKILLKIVNVGFADAKFVSVEVSPFGYVLLSEQKVYIGTIGSDDSDTASFDVIFNNKNARFSSVIKYRDFDNQEKIENIDLPINIYTTEKAIELGIIKKSNTPTYAGVIFVLLILWWMWRKLKRKKKLRVSERG
ncbi:MAG: hypothetical protein ABIG37_01545 [Nanoarchaeota archaeon]|nr:hypothetical protein [Nanoarchaeota archaeon]